MPDYEHSCSKKPDDCVFQFIVKKGGLFRLMELRVAGFFGAMDVEIAVLEDSKCPWCGAQLS